MKWGKKMLFLLLAASFFVGLFAETTKADGGANFGKVTLEAIDGTGLIKLNGTTVENDVHVVGSLIANNGKIGSLNVVGEANLTEVTVAGGGAVMGSFQAVHSTIEKPITLLSQRAVITNSKLAGITVKQDSAFKGKQVIELRRGTLVDGPIHFESGKGEVLLYPGSQVLGPITGGKVIKKN